MKTRMLMAALLLAGCTQSNQKPEAAVGAAKAALSKKEVSNSADRVAGAVSKAADEVSAKLKGIGVKLSDQREDTKKAGEDK